MPKKPKRESVQITFHSAKTGQKHGPAITLGNVNPSWFEKKQSQIAEAGKFFPQMEAMIIRRPADKPKAFGYTHIKDADWKQIFGSKKKKKK